LVEKDQAGSLIEAALTWPLPQVGSTLAIWPSDEPIEMLDRIAAAALLTHRMDGEVGWRDLMSISDIGSVGDRLRLIIEGVATRRGPWKPRPLPTRENPWPDEIERIAEYLFGLRLYGARVDEQISFVRNWLLEGRITGDAMEVAPRIDAEVRRTIEAFESALTLTPSRIDLCTQCGEEFGESGETAAGYNVECVHCGHNEYITECCECESSDSDNCDCPRIATVESSDVGSIDTALRVAPVVIWVQPDWMCSTCCDAEKGYNPMNYSPGPCRTCDGTGRVMERHITIAVWPGHWDAVTMINMINIRCDLNRAESIWYTAADATRRTFNEAYGDGANCDGLAMEPGWTQVGDRLLSPTGRSTELTVEQVMEIIREVTR
jgi:hypothetical protein